MNVQTVMTRCRSLVLKGKQVVARRTRQTEAAPDREKSVCKGRGESTEGRLAGAWREGEAGISRGWGQGSGRGGDWLRSWSPKAQLESEWQSGCRVDSRGSAWL